MTQKKRKQISEPEKRRLWVLAGGRCELCNKYLLEDERTAHRLNLGELAHNVGQSQAPGSPRGGADLQLDQRDLADNLLLLCGDDHHLIDARITRGEFTVEDLRRRKREHEDRIRYLTALKHDQETVVLRIIGQVRGAPVELSNESVRRAVLANGDRYPRYSLGYAGADVEIDLRGLPDEAAGAYWETGKRTIAEVIDHSVRHGVREGAIRHLSIFGLARIPFLAYAGFLLDDKVPLDIYQRHRADSDGWNWDKAAEAVSFETVLVRGGSDATAVALTLSLSGSINPAELPDAIDRSYSIYDLRPVGAAPGRDILRSQASLAAFAETYHAFLADLEQRHAYCRELTVFPAVPVSAAITLGRGLMREAQPALVIYDRVGASYVAALEINR
jgi:hypothetical protein